MSKVVSLLVVVLVVSPLMVANSTPPPSDPQATAFAAKSIAAMTGGTTISDVTLTGNAIWSGSDTEGGTATLQALGNGESRMDLALTSGTRTEIRDAQTGSALGKWISPDGTSGNSALHNCRTDAVWFLPVLSSLGAGPNVVLTYVGQETRNGATVQHIQSYVYMAGPFPSPTPQQLSTMDFYLDAASFLPLTITYSAHPDNDASTNLPVEVDFSNYQAISGLAVPMHIQRYQQGTLMVDVVVTGALFNTGLPLSMFAVN